MDFLTYKAYNIAARGPVNDLEVRPNSGIHPLFGIVTTTNGGEILSNPDTLKAQFEDYVPRELGISKEIVKNNRILKGLANPGNYLLVKNQDLEAIGKELAAFYRDEYIKQINYGKSMEEAKKRAMSFAAAIETIKMKEHDEKFPIELTRETMNKLKRKNEQGNF